MKKSYKILSEEMQEAIREHEHSIREVQALMELLQASKERRRMAQLTSEQAQKRWRVEYEKRISRGRPCL